MKAKLNIEQNLANNKRPNMKYGMNRKGNDLMRAYQYRDCVHKSFLQSSEWYPLNGDLCICAAHIGDNLDKYTVIRINRRGNYKKVGTIKAHSFGEQIGKVLIKDYELLLRGQLVYCTFIVK